MENGAQALLMAAAVLIFVIALTVSFTTLSQAKSTADSVLFYSDRELFQEKVDEADLIQYRTDEARLVHIDTIIATIKRFTRENFAVKVLDKRNTELLNLDYSISTIDSFEGVVSDFIRNYMSSSSEFLETFVEINTGGITSTGDDGTSLGENVGKKIFIIYKEKDI